MREEKCCYIPKRYILVALAHLGFMTLYSLRINLSVAIVAMVNNTYAHVEPKADPECRTDKNITVHISSSDKDGEFKWDQKQQGVLLSTFFYGYMCTQLLGGVAAKKYGGKRVLAWAILLSSLITLMTPVLAHASFGLLLAARVVLGFAQGVMFPGMHNLLAKWCRSDEKARMAVVVYSGPMSGSVVALPIFSILCGSAWGWPVVFYGSGTLALVWVVLWNLCISDTPEQHPTISHEEKTLILDSQKESVTNIDTAAIPWPDIFTSIRFWAILVAHFCHNWLWYLILTDLPMYFKQVLDFKITENGFLSALPFIAAFLSPLASGFLSDYSLRKGMSVTQVRRLSGMFAFYSAAVCLVLASYAKCEDIALSVVYMVLGTGCICVNESSYMVNGLDIAPRFSSIIMGISNTIATVPGCVAPLVTGYFTNNHPTREQYRKVFLIAAAVSVVGGSFYGAFVSGVQQEWNDRAKNEKCSKYPNYKALVDEND